MSSAFSTSSIGGEYLDDVSMPWKVRYIGGDKSLYKRNDSFTFGIEYVGNNKSTYNNDNKGFHVTVKEFKKNSCIRFT